VCSSLCNSLVISEPHRGLLARRFLNGRRLVLYVGGSVVELAQTGLSDHRIADASHHANMDVSTPRTLAAHRARFRQNGGGVAGHGNRYQGTLIFTDQREEAVTKPDFKSVSDIATIAFSTSPAVHLFALSAFIRVHSRLSAVFRLLGREQLPHQKDDADTTARMRRSTPAYQQPGPTPLAEGPRLA